MENKINGSGVKEPNGILFMFYFMQGLLFVHKIINPEFSWFLTLLPTTIMFAISTIIILICLTVLPRG